ncbi:hypothetical protein M408DRAFT_13199, partial [Serendipita vermifera MAFF 305830]
TGQGSDSLKGTELGQFVAQSSPRLAPPTPWRGKDTRSPRKRKLETFASSDIEEEEPKSKRRKANYEESNIGVYAAPQDSPFLLDGGWHETDLDSDTWGIESAIHITGINSRDVANQVPQGIETTPAGDNSHQSCCGEAQDGVSGTRDRFSGPSEEDRNHDDVEDADQSNANTSAAETTSSTDGVTPHSEGRLDTRHEYEDSSEIEEQDEDEDEDEYYFQGGTEDEHLDDLASLFSEDNSRSNEEDKKEDDDNTNDENGHGECEEYESDVESEVELSSKGDDSDICDIYSEAAFADTEIDPPQLDTAADMTEHEENNQEDVGETTEEEQEEENDEGPEWATVLSHIQAGDYSSAIAAVPTIQRPSHIKGVAEVAAYLDSHAIKYKRLAVGKTANKLSVCRLTRRFLDGEWKEIEPYVIVLFNGDVIPRTATVTNVQRKTPGAVEDLVKIPTLRNDHSD